MIFINSRMTSTIITRFPFEKLHCYEIDTCHCWAALKLLHQSWKTSSRHIFWQQNDNFNSINLTWICDGFYDVITHGNVSFCMMEISNFAEKSSISAIFLRTHIHQAFVMWFEFLIEDESSMTLNLRIHQRRFTWIWNFYTLWNEDKMSKSPTVD